MRIGIDLGGTKTEAIALADNGGVLARRRIASPQGDYWATVTAIARLVHGIEDETGKRGTVGVGMPGVISPATGLVKNANSTWLIGRPFDRDLAEALERPVRLSNDANCFALSEASDGSGAGCEVVFGAILGTGVGAGLAIRGRPLLGCNAIAGEWGHNPLPWPADDERPGRRCYCGQQGCIETFLSGPGLLADWRSDASGPAGDVRELLAAAEAGTSAALACLGRYEDRLARALAHVINIVDPDVIVLGGGLSQIERLYRNVPPLLSRYVFSDEVATRIKPPAHGDASGVRGAAWLWSLEESRRRKNQEQSYG